jgi:PAP2 superfamily protein
VSTQVRTRPSLPGGRVLSDGHVLYWWAEILLIIGFYVVYSAVRNLNGNSLLDPPAHALDHAKQIIELERQLGIFQEARIQHWAEHFTPLIVAANYFYGSLHFVVTIFAGVFLYRRYSDDYPRFRNAIGIITSLALIGFTLYPLTPPRLLHMYGVNYGFSDTLAQYPTFWSFNSGGMKSLSNQFAAMPSVHIAWSTWCALALAPRLRSRSWRIVAACYPLMTLIVIVITGNHYFLDAVGGWIILAIGWYLSGLVTRAGPARRVPELLA